MCEGPVGGYRYDAIQATIDFRQSDTGNIHLSKEHKSLCAKSTSSPDSAFFRHENRKFWQICPI